MNWKASPPAIEIVSVAVAATSLGSAVAFAIMRTAPFGAGPAHALAAGAVVALVGWKMVGCVDRRRAFQSFVAATALVDDADADILLLDGQAHDAQEDALLLDDPLPVLSDDMRVVRLFALDPVATVEAKPPVGPAEMIARIEDFLGQPRGSVSAMEEPRAASDAVSQDASAALHLALADIRRSLRQG